MRKGFLSSSSDLQFGAEKRLPAAGPGPKLAVLLAAALSIIPVSSRGDSSPVIWGERIDVARGKAVRGPGGGVHLVWTVGEEPAANIRYTISHDRGRTFGRPRTIVESDGYSDAPKIAVDGRGTIHLVYAEGPAGPLQRYHVRYSRSEKGDGAFLEPMEISSAHSAIFKSVGFPYLGLDGQGNLYVLWELFPDEGFRPKGLGLTFSGDGGKSFSTPTPPCEGSNTRISHVAFQNKMG